MEINLNLPTLPTQDQKDAMDNANAPDGTNVFITANDLTIPTLQEVTDSGNTTTNDIQFDSGAGILLDNTSRLREGTIDAGLGGTKGIAQICAVGYELKWEAGRLYVMDGNGLLIRHSLHNFTTIPSANDDDTKGYYVGSLWTLDNGVSYICTDSTSTAATWSLYEATPQVNSDWNATSGVEEILNKPTIPTKTSDLTNDGDDGNPFISLQDLPSNIVLYPTTVASDIAGYFKMVQSITDPNYNTVAVDVSTGAISGTAQLISSLATSANIIVGNPGVFDITTIGNIRKVSGTGEAEFYFSVYKRNLAGTETLIIQSNNTLPVTNGGYAEFSATGLWNDGLFISTDRIVIKYYANRIAGGSNPTYEFQFGGSLPVRTLVPIPLTVVPFITLDEVADVTISGVANNDLLAYDNATSLWKNKTSSDLGLVSELITTNRQVASYSLALSDKNKLVEMNVGSANNLTIPLDSSISFAIGTQILLSQYGAGQTTVLPTGGVTLRSAGGKTKLTSQYSGATLIKIATDEWYLFGDITT